MGHPTDVIVPALRRHPARIVPIPTLNLRNKSPSGIGTPGSPRAGAVPHAAALPQKQPPGHRHGRFVWP